MARFRTIKFHGVPIFADESGNLIDPVTAVARTMRIIIDAFGIAGMLFCASVVFGYGSAIAAHTGYHARSATGVFLGSRLFSGNEGSRYVAPNATVSDGAVLQTVWTGNEPAQNLPVGAIGEIFIPAIGVRAPIIGGTFTVAEVNDALKKGVALWPGSVGIGNKGASIFLGHSSAPFSYSGKYATVFSRLGDLEQGDTIELWLGGILYEYRVRDRIIVNPRANKTELLSSSGQTLLLVSCWPLGTDWNRIVVRADRQ